MSGEGEAWVVVGDTEQREFPNQESAVARAWELTPAGEKRREVRQTQTQTQKEALRGLEVRLYASTESDAVIENDSHLITKIATATFIMKVRFPLTSVTGWSTNKLHETVQEVMDAEAAKYGLVCATVSGPEMFLEHGNVTYVEATGTLRYLRTE